MCSGVTEREVSGGKFTIISVKNEECRGHRTGTETNQVSVVLYIYIYSLISWALLLPFGSWCLENTGIRMYVHGAACA